MSHPADFQYRQAYEADIAALLQFVPATLQGSWSVDAMQQLLRANRVRVLAAGDTGEVVGFAEFSLVLDESELLSLVVHPLFQQQGLGKLLLSEVLKEAAALGAMKIFLEVRESNTVARNLYEHRGFVQNGIRSGYYSPTGAGMPREDACLYSLGLESSSRD